MDGLTLTQLVGKLTLTVQVLTAYPEVGPLPEVQLMPQAALNEIVCTSFCNAQGAYLPERGLLLADDLDPLSSIRDRAVLLHELVHVAQERAGAFAELPPCERYYRREAQAYAAEHIYLRRFGLSGHTLAGPQRWLGASCTDDDDISFAAARPAPSEPQGASSPASPLRGGSQEPR